jgi:hypothetical protein
MLQKVGHGIPESLLASLLFDLDSEYANMTAQENWKELEFNGAHQLLNCANGNVSSNKK